MKHAFLPSMDNKNNIIRTLAYNSICGSQNLNFWGLEQPTAVMIFGAGIFYKWLNEFLESITRREGSF